MRGREREEAEGKLNPYEPRCSCEFIGDGFSTAVGKCQRWDMRERERLELSQVGTCRKTHTGPNRDYGNGHGTSTTVADIKDEREAGSEFTVSRDQISERKRERPRDNLTHERCEPTRRCKFNPYGLRRVPWPNRGSQITQTKAFLGGIGGSRDLPWSPHFTSVYNKKGTKLFYPEHVLNMWPLLL